MRGTDETDRLKRHGWDGRTMVLRCMGCGAVAADDGARLTCEHEHGPALLRSRYAERRLTVEPDDSLLRYAHWLPSARRIQTQARTGVYPATALAARLGLRRVWVAFSGWWPERGATLPTATFKDLEAVAVLQRRPAGDTRTLVISSAGNTALAFARACGDNGIPALIVVPMRGWREMLADHPLDDSVRVVAIADADYEAAIAFARELCGGGDFVLEGGVRNVARRDGMGTALLAAAEAIGALPDAYFQAVGSAAGALAAHEAALRLITDGRFGDRLPRLMLSQNVPFTPIHDAWTAGRRALLPRSVETAAAQIGRLGAFVLSNLAPPYDAAGGIYEALVESGGATAAVTSAEMLAAMTLFAECEGVAIEPAGGVALAHLRRAAEAGAVGRDDVVLLHVTGGGRRRVAAPARPAHPSLVVDAGEPRARALERARLLCA